MAKQASKPGSRTTGGGGRARAKPAAKAPDSAAKAKKSPARPAAAASKPAGGTRSKKQTAAASPKKPKLQAAGKAITSGHSASAAKSTRTRAAGAASRPASRTGAAAGGRPKPQARTRAATAKKARPAKRVNFDRKTLAGIRKSLQDQRKDLMEQLEDIEEAAFSPSQTEASSEAGFDEDYADAGTATFEREKDLSIANNISDLVDKIDKALEKIAQGTYGICENCGQPISADRLKALPHVLLCINCKKAEERR